MRVVPVARIGTIFPDVSVREAFALQLLDQFAFGHSRKFSANQMNRKSEARHDNALPAEMGVAAERARRLQERRSLFEAIRVLVYPPAEEAQPHPAHDVPSHAN